VDCGPEWDWSTIEMAVARGAHRSAMEPESIQLVHEDIKYQVEAGFSEILLWEDIKRLRPRYLKISPIAVIPQKDRRGRIILDLSFPVYPEKSTGARGKRMEPIQASVNDTTTKLAPSGPVEEIGNVFRRLLSLIDSAEADEVVMLSKIDLSDGFWRMLVEEEQKWNFAYVMPDPPGHPTRIVVPSALQMGWAESPAYFCAATETGRDIIQGLVADKTHLPPHCLEEYLRPAKAAKRSRSDSPVHGVYVYVDDYIGAAVENASGTLLGRIARSALHGIHSIFPPPAVTGHVGGKDPVSIKKLERGDGQWHHEKELLGFLVDGAAKTVRISQTKSDDICNELRRIQKKKRVPLKRYRKIIGKLRHVALILPGTKGLFSPINKALRGEPAFIGLGKNSELRAALIDLAAMVRSLASRPTHIKELMPGDDHYTGYTDACASGAGGVWLSGELGLAPIVWRVHFPESVSSQVVSESNPMGRLTNSDLEMAAALLHYMVLQTEVDLRFKRAGALSDNTPTVAWTKRLADKSQSLTAGRLLRGLTAVQRASQAGPYTVASVAGIDNDMADVASRSFHPTKGPDLTCDSVFLTHFNTRFPLPQNLCWTLVHPTPVTISLVISTLVGERLTLQRWMTPFERQTGGTGLSFVPTHDATPTCSIPPNPSNSSCLSVSLLGCGEVTTAEVVKSSLKHPKPPSVTWPRPSCWLDTPTRDGRTEPATTWTSHSQGSKNPTRMRTQHPSPSSPCP
jgi:hypothetical protein